LANSMIKGLFIKFGFSLKSFHFLQSESSMSLESSLYCLRLGPSEAKFANIDQDNSIKASQICPCSFSLDGDSERTVEAN